MAEWEIRRKPWDEQEWQKLYGDDVEIVVSDRGREIMWIGLAEVIDAVGPRYVLAHVLERLRCGADEPDADGLSLSGDIYALTNPKPAAWLLQQSDQWPATVTFNLADMERVKANLFPAVGDKIVRPLVLLPANARIEPGRCE